MIKRLLYVTKIKNFWFPKTVKNSKKSLSKSQIPNSVLVTSPDSLIPHSHFYWG